MSKHNTTKNHLKTFSDKATHDGVAVANRSWFAWQFVKRNGVTTHHTYGKAFDGLSVIKRKGNAVYHRVADYAAYERKVFALMNNERDQKSDNLAGLRRTINDLEHRIAKLEGQEEQPRRRLFGLI